MTVLACAAGPACASASVATLRIGLAGEVTTIDPHVLNIAPNNNVGWHIFDALTNVDDHARLIPGLAVSWRAVDATTWEFKLRSGVKFHDGEDFDARDVIASLERPLHVRNGQFNSFVQRIVAKEIVDAHTVRLKTARPYALLPLDLDSIFIIPARFAGATSTDFDSGRAAVGTGPFKFVAFRRGESVELRRNDQYWGNAPPWAAVSLRIIPADRARIAALISGDVDMIEAVPTADIAALRAHGRFAITQTTSWRTLFFHLDQWRSHPPSMQDKQGKPLADNPFKDRRVRLAVAKAIDRQGIVDHLMDGAALAASNLVAPGVFGYAADLKPTAFDPAAARALLREAGYPDGFTLTVSGPNNRYVNDARILQAVAAMLARIGIATRVAAIPMSAYIPKARGGDFSFMMLGWGSYSAVLALRTLAVTPDTAKGDGAWNWSHYSNPALDALIERSFEETDDAQREATARDAMRVAIEDVAVVPLHHQFAVWAMRAEVGYQGRTDEFTFAHEVRGTLAQEVRPHD